MLMSTLKLLPFIVFFLFIIYSIISRIYGQKRVKDLRKFAKKNGFRYHENDNILYWDDLSKFGVFQSGRNKKAKSLMTSKKHGIDWKIFDFEYKKGSGSHSRHHVLTVFLAQPEDDLPDFQMKKENLLGKVSSALGGQDIDFEMNPEFSDKYILRSKDPNIKMRFNSFVRDHFEENDFNFAIESMGDKIIFYNEEKVKPSRLNRCLRKFSRIIEKF